ncbi:uncharacterized protein LOC128680469 [Plodia interpunctella]|uniref:uncharacterized protein LOC128680469 n=1 Tax=Plodia interpunctella TaxID=58824 RepID=UPI002367FA3C|nr:uncharacterized protein LOC128680469 [Plodia interpunctella]
MAPKSSKDKKLCRFCQHPVGDKSGVKCKGDCGRWAHYKCLGFTPQMILDAHDGKIDLACICPNCSAKMFDYELNREIPCVQVDGACPTVETLQKRFKKPSACEPIPLCSNDQCMKSMDPRTKKTFCACHPTAVRRQEPPTTQMQPNPTTVETMALQETKPVFCVCHPTAMKTEEAQIKESAASDLSRMKTKASRKTKPAFCVCHPTAVKTEDQRMKETSASDPTTAGTKNMAKNLMVCSCDSQRQLTPNKVSRKCNCQGEAASKSSKHGVKFEPEKDKPETNLPPYMSCGPKNPCWPCCPNYPCKKNSRIKIIPYKYKNYNYKLPLSDCNASQPSEALFDSMTLPPNQNLVCDSSACRSSTCGQTGLCNDTLDTFMEKFRLPSCSKEPRSIPMISNARKPKTLEQPKEMLKATSFPTSDPLANLYLGSENAPCRNCKCEFGPTLDQFKCVSALCSAKHPKNLSAPILKRK